MAAPGSNLKINGERLWDTLMEMAKIGPGVKGGNRRLTLTDVDREGRDLFKSWAQDAGCTIAIDTMGNMFARREGTDSSLPPVMVGSHLDTQPTGGKFDGVLGVLSGLEILRTLNDLGIKTKHPIEVVNWTNEEGSRYAPAMIASGVFAGAYTQDYAYKLKDAEGKELGEELKRRSRVALRGLRGVGYMPEMLNPLRHPWLAFQLVSHRLLRWAVPLFLIAALVSNALLLDRPAYAVLFALQLVFYGSALAAALLDRWNVRVRPLFVPLYFCLINLAPLLAFWALLKGEKKILWETGPQPSA